MLTAVNHAVCGSGTLQPTSTAAAGQQSQLMPPNRLDTCTFVHDQRIVLCKVVHALPHSERKV